MQKIFAAILFIVVSISTVTVSAQTGSVSGSVTSSGKGLQMATIFLLKAADSSWVKTELTDEQGAFILKDVAIGNYMVSVTMLGYEQGFHVLTIKDTVPVMCAISLSPKSGTMKEVTVTAKKPFIEMGLGKMVINVEGSPTAISSNVLELLRRLPGVSVDQNGNISMHGKDGVLVLVNDRPTYISGDQLAEYLKGITATEIAQLELITQPGAKYDAAGNTGVINIKLKKNSKIGLNGSATVQPGQSFYSNARSSLLLNYKRNKLNLLLNATNTRGGNFADWTEDQYFTDPLTNNVLSKSHIFSTPIEHYSVTTLRLAADYDLTDKTTIGFNSRGTYHPNTMTSHVFATRYDNVANTYSYNDIYNPDNSLKKDITTNVYLSHKFSKESSLDINADHVIYSNQLNQDFTNATLDDHMQQVGIPLALHSSQPSLINVYSLKADYTNTLKNGIKLEAGLKSSWVRTESRADFSILLNNDWVNDTTRSNRFVYTENINALYLNAAKDLNAKWSTSIGLRAEQTLADGTQYVHNNHFTRQYVSLFPTFFLSYKHDTDNQFEFNYGRRLDRPRYQQLNPFLHYSFQYSYFTGNPYLLPQYTNSIQLKHSYKNTLITTLTLSQTSDVITDVLIADNATKIVYGINKNLAENKTADIVIGYNRDLKKWWSLNVWGDMYYAVYSGMIGTEHAINKGFGKSMGISSQFSFVKDWKTEVQFYYGGKSVNTIVETFGENIYTSLGASKKLGTHILLRMAIDDPFDIYRMYTHNELSNFHSDSKFRRASRNFAVSFTYSFGNSQSGEHKQNSIDEKSRL